MLNEQEFNLLHTLIEAVTERKATDEDIYEIIAHAQVLLRVQKNRPIHTTRKEQAA